MKYQDWQRMSKEINNDSHFYTEISGLLKQARSVAFKAVNTVMVQTYWQIGRRIVEQEQKGQSRAGYGNYLITNLSRHLSDSFGKGFSEANLKNIRQFYVTFPNYEEFSTHRMENLQSATHRVANLSWTNIRLIMRLDDPKERDYYIQESASQNWSSRLLERNIKSGYYHRLLSTQQLSSETEDEKHNPPDFIKDPYIAEFFKPAGRFNRQRICFRKSVNWQPATIFIGTGKRFLLCCPSNAH